MNWEIWLVKQFKTSPQSPTPPRTLRNTSNLGWSRSINKFWRTAIWVSDRWHQLQVSISIRKADRFWHQLQVSFSIRKATRTKTSSRYLARQNLVFKGTSPCKASKGIPAITTFTASRWHDDRTFNQAMVTSITKFRTLARTAAARTWAQASMWTSPIYSLKATPESTRQDLTRLTSVVILPSD